MFGGCNPSGTGFGACDTAHLSYVASGSHAESAGGGLQRSVDVWADQHGESNVCGLDQPEQFALAISRLIGTAITGAKQVPRGCGDQDHCSRQQLRPDAL
jgi:hypothetical protein